VSIDIVESISIARRAARRLLAPGIKVGISVKAASKNAADTMVSKLTATNINAKLQEAGLPPATIVEAPKTVAREETVKADGNSDAVQEEESLVKEAGKELILGIVGAIGGAIGMAILGYLYKKFGMQDPNAPAPAASGQSQDAGRLTTNKTPTATLGSAGSGVPQRPSQARVNTAGQPIARF